jgi:uncharacterized protein
MIADAVLSSTSTASAAVNGLDWTAIDESLDAGGFARLPAILPPEGCEALAALYKDDSRFRSRVDMARFRFGLGEYKYFAAPLPAIVQTLREELYARLAPIANRWVARLTPSRAKGSSEGLAEVVGAGKPDNRPDGYPDTLDEFLRKCHTAGQARPTPLLLSYTAGGYNCLHQDLYGDLAFPLQVVFVLNRVFVDFTGGEFLLIEQRPRAQSRGHSITVEQGAAVVFATSDRPVAGTRGSYRVVMRHGVSTITSGSRMSLGVIFHDAR